MIHQWQAHEVPHAAGAADAVAVAVSPAPLSVAVEAPSAAGAAVVPEEPPLKSVAYQPEPLS